MRKWYKTIGKVYCPCLYAYITFNAKGFRHLRYDGKGKERTIAEQIIRLNLLPLVAPLIKQSIKVNENRLSHDGKKTFFTLQGRVGVTKLRIVLIRQSNGKIIYFSVMKPR